MVENMVIAKGYQVYTTLSSSQQQAAQSAVFKGLLDCDIRHGYRGAEKHLDKGRCLEHRANYQLSQWFT